MMKLLLMLFIVFVPTRSDEFDEENYGVKYADDCEACKIVSTELSHKLFETEKSSEVLETGYNMQQKKKRTAYKTSELRLIEILESVCEAMLSYNIHKERTDSTRFAKGQSQTFSALEGLVAKGVKVDIGIPHGLWDKPSAEISQLKTQCEKILEDHEEDIEHWYFSLQDKISLQNYLCKEKLLKNDIEKSRCLTEVLKIKGEKDEL